MKYVDEMIKEGDIFENFSTLEIVVDRLLDLPYHEYIISRYRLDSALYHRGLGHWAYLLHQRYVPGSTRPVKGFSGASDKSELEYNDLECKNELEYNDLE